MTAPSATPRRRDWVAWLEQRLNVTELFSFLTHFGIVYTPVNTSRPIRDTLEDVRREPLSSYARWPRILGVLAVLLFLIEAVTGLLLAFYYRPTSTDAFGSTRLIVRDLPFGWFIHQIHAWGAIALIAVVAVRLVRLFWEGLYRPPRELLWWAAIALLWLTLQADITGRLLTWDARSYWSVVRGLEVVYTLPFVGPLLAFLIGGRVVNDDVLLRFYVLHILVLPLLFTAAVYVTFATLRRVGLSPVSGEHRGRTITYRDHLYSMATLVVLVFAVLVSLAALVPFSFPAPANPYVTPVGLRPPWYFLAPYALIERTPGPAGIWGLVWLGAAVGMVALPFFARRGSESMRRIRLAGIAAFVAWAVLSVAGALLERT